MESQSRSKSLETLIIQKVLVSRKPQGLNRIAQIGYGHLCLSIKFYIVIEKK
jgi:hypothetical protein